MQDADFVPPTAGAKDTELANARRLVAQHGRDLRYCHPWRCWLVWDGRRWQRDGTGAVLRRAKDTVLTIYGEAGDAVDPGERKALSRWAQKSEARNQIQNMVVLAESEPTVPVTPAELDADPWLLNCRNGTLDLRTGALRPHARADLISRLVDIDFDPEATCPTWEYVLDRILPSERLRCFLQRAVGYSLSGDTREQVLFLLHGTGANGKTVTLETTQRVVGDYGRRAQFEAFLMSDHDRVRNDLAALVGARFVSAVEVDAGRRLSEVVVKELTGGDTVSCRFLYGEFFDYTPQYKVWLAANHKPTIRGSDHAIWRRIRLIPFTVTIPDAEQDRNLPEKLRAEAAGVLSWAVRGCLDWQAHGLDEPEEVLAATAAYREEMDVLGGFLTDCCLVDPRAKESAASLYQAYEGWANAAGERAVSKRTFGRLLGERGFTDTRTERARMWTGLALRNDGTDAS
ncbi:MAG: phage/plasmid primase, P4 family [Chloroflexota bacterium]|nr:phage/plasmid primase, P4 family [Chloroflexota bacterium]MDQ6898249.1 phage/plasmid primase, P4 family [Candidatus Dormibacteraeota bacterium]